MPRVRQILSELMLELFGETSVIQNDPDLKIQIQTSRVEIASSDQ